MLLVLKWRLYEKQEAKEHSDRRAMRQQPIQNVGYFGKIAGLTQKTKSSAESRDIKDGYWFFEIML